MRWHAFPGGSRCAGLPRKMHKTAYFWGGPAARGYLKRVMRDGTFPGGSCCAGLPRKMHKTAYFWGAPVARDYLKKVMAWQFPHNHDNRKQTSAPMTHVYVMRMYWHATAGCNTLTCSQWYSGPFIRYVMPRYTYLLAMPIYIYLPKYLFLSPTVLCIKCMGCHVT